LPNLIGLSALGMLSVAATHNAKAFTLYNGEEYGNNVEINLTTTVSWTPIWRTNNPSKIITSDANSDDGDLAGAHGLVSNLFEVLPVLDIKDGEFGAHFSGEAYLNTTYLGTNDIVSAGPLNYTVPKPNDYTSATRNVNGENARLLDALVYGAVHFGAGDNQTLSVRLGRETLLWGQSLYLSSNGIAGVMAPFDVQTADNNPNAQTQQIIEPLGQVEVTYQPNEIVTLQGYFKFEWAHDYFPGAATFQNTSDLIGPGNSRLVVNTGFPAPFNYFYLKRIGDNRPSGTNGDFGISTQLTLGEYDVGFYALRADSYAPVVATTPTLNYLTLYPRDIWVEGSSFSTTVGQANVAGEFSFRQHMNLAQGSVVQFPDNNANSNPAYPTGNTYAAQVSAIYLTPGYWFDPGGIAMTGEIGMNHVLATTANKDATAWFAGLHRSATAAQFVAVATPTYYNVLPNLQLGFPIGLHYTFYGRSEIDSTENHGTGSINFGVQATYRLTWIASVTFNDFIGNANTLLAGEPSGADRNFILANLQHSF
jgi:hypothetical protein